MAIVLGTGGFGTTILVNRPRAIGGRDFGRDYALKILHGQAIQDKRRREQFLSDIKALGALDHGNIVKYEGCGEQDGRVYLVMQLCSGGDLERLVLNFGAFSERTALQVTLQVCDGLREAHRKNYLHRDIKPRNILLFESVPSTADLQWFEEGINEGRLCFKLVDFGLAGRLDHEMKTTGFAGSSMFCSPEQVRERELDARSDIYSLGMTLWYLVQGRGPLLRADGHPIEDSREAMSAQTSPTPHDERFPPSLAPEFTAVVSRMLRKSPDQRFNSVDELSQAIRRVLESDALPKSTGLTASRSSEPDEVPLEDQPDYGKGDPEDLYSERTEYGRRSLGKFYRAISRNSMEAVALTAWDSMASPDAQQQRELAQKLQKLKRVTNLKDAPPSLTVIKGVNRTAKGWCVAEEWHDGIPLSELVACRGRSLSLEELAQLLMPVAEAADFLLTHEINYSMLTLGGIQLCGSGLAPDDRSWLALPVDQWGDWRIQLSALSVSADLISTVESSLPSSGTISSSLVSDDESTLSIGKAFCRLFYRMGEGSEVAAAADWDEYSYTEANRLTAASNVLLRRVICGADEAKSVGELLRKICSNEGVYRLLSSSAMTSGMRRTHMSIRRSDSKAAVDVSSSVIIGPEPAADAEPEGVRAALSRDLDRGPSDSIDMTQVRSDRVPIVQPSIALEIEVAQIVEGGVGRVRSPYGGRREQQVSGPAWRANGQIYCAETDRPFRLPRNLTPLEAVLIQGRFDVALSPYWDPPVEFAIPLGRWVAGGEVTCEQTGLPLRLPLNLPVPVANNSPSKPNQVLPNLSGEPEIAVIPLDCTACAPKIWKRGEVVLLQIFINRRIDRMTVVEMAKEVDSSAVFRGAVALSKPVASGQQITIAVVVPECTVHPAVQTLLWSGSPESATFSIKVPSNLADNRITPIVTVFVDQVPIGNLIFIADIVDPNVQGSGTQDVSFSPFKKVFISYSAANRVEVLKRVQVLAALKISYFMDFLGSQPGDDWAEKLMEKLSECDGFFVYWSEAASRSEWVRRELREAVRLRGTRSDNRPALVPIPIEGPPIAKIPEEAAHLHFNDSLIYAIRAAELEATRM